MPSEWDVRIGRLRAACPRPQLGRSQPGRSLRGPVMSMPAVPRVDPGAAPPRADGRRTGHNLGLCLLRRYSLERFRGRAYARDERKRRAWAAGTSGVPPRPDCQHSATFFRSSQCHEPIRSLAPARDGPDRPRTAAPRMAAADDKQSRHRPPAPLTTAPSPLLPGTAGSATAFARPPVWMPRALFCLVPTDSPARRPPSCPRPRASTSDNETPPP